MDDERRNRTAGIEPDTRQPVPPASREPLGYGPGEWASTARTEPVGAETADAGTEQRLRNAEAAIDALRTTTRDLEREVAVMRADLERLRQEHEKAAGSRLP
jgi:hypothetical protein